MDTRGCKSGSYGECTDAPRGGRRGETVPASNGESGLHTLHPYAAISEAFNPSPRSGSGTAGDQPDALPAEDNLARFPQLRRGIETNNLSNKGCESAARETPGPVRLRAAARVRTGRIPQRCGGQPVARDARDDDVSDYPLRSSRGPSRWSISAVDAQRGGMGCDRDLRRTPSPAWRPWPDGHEDRRPCGLSGWSPSLRGLHSAAPGSGSAAPRQSPRHTPTGRS